MSRRDRIPRALLTISSAMLITWILAPDPLLLWSLPDDPTPLISEDSAIDLGGREIAIARIELPERPKPALAEFTPPEHAPDEPEPPEPQEAEATEAFSAEARPPEESLEAPDLAEVRAPAELAEPAEIRESSEPIAQSPEHTPPPPEQRESPAAEPSKPEPDRSSEPISVKAASLERGRKRLRDGRFPRLRASYRSIGFTAYRDAMLALGGGFFIYDGRAHRPLAEIDPVTRQIVGDHLPSGLSMWPRDITQHARTMLSVGRRRFGRRASRVVLLPPESLDAALLGGLEQEARSQGVDPTRITRVDLAYRISDRRLECEVFGLRLRDGSERQVAIRIWLSKEIPEMPG